MIGQILFVTSRRILLEHWRDKQASDLRQMNLFRNDVGAVTLFTSRSFPHSSRSGLMMMMCVSGGELSAAHFVPGKPL